MSGPHGATGGADRRGRRGRRRPLALLLPALLAGIAACGVPTGDDSFEPIDPAEIPFELAQPATTTTTSTTTTTTVPDAPDTTLPPPTTTPNEIALIYFLSRDELRPAEVLVAAPLDRNDLISLLEAGPPDDSASVLDNLIDQGLIRSVTEQGSIVTIDLDFNVFRRIRTSDQRFAVAQMVLTFVDNLRRIGLAEFTLDGEPIDVPLGNGLLSDGPVEFDDYANLLVNPGPGAATTTSTVPPTTDDDGATVDTAPATDADDG